MERLSIETWKESLSKHHQKLRTGVIVRHFLPELYKLPLTEVELTQIGSKPDDMSQVDELIAILKTKTKEHFDKFCSVLEENGCKHWAEKLRGASTSVSATAHAPRLQMAAATPPPVPPPPVPPQPVLTEAATVQKDALAKLKGRYQLGDTLFRILVVGEPGSGKSTLIQSLFGLQLKGKRGELREYSVSANECPFVFYISYGVKEDTHKQIKAIKKQICGGSLSLVIYCLPINDTRLRNTFFDTVKKYSEIGVKGDKFLLAFTFADVLPVPKQQRSQPDFDIGAFFMKKHGDWTSEMKQHFLDQAVLPESDFKAIRLHSTTEHSTVLLPNGRDWYGPLWADILDILLSRATNV